MYFLVQPPVASSHLGSNILQHSVLKHPQATFFPKVGTWFHTRKWNRYNYNGEENDVHIKEGKSKYIYKESFNNLCTGPTL